MSEPTNKLPKTDAPDPALDAKVMDPLDLVRTEGYPENPQEALQNPALAPEMVNAPGDLRADVADPED